MEVQRTYVKNAPPSELQISNVDAEPKDVRRDMLIAVVGSEVLPSSRIRTFAGIVFVHS